MARRSRITEPFDHSTPVTFELPSGLLDASVDDRIRYFRMQRYKHPVLVEARDKLIHYILHP